MPEFMKSFIKTRFEALRADWRCIPRENTKVSGPYNSDLMKRIDIRLNRNCSSDNTKGCSDDYFKNGYIILITNRIKFDNKKFGKESIVKEVEMKWIPV